jgi:secreted PhoX family phosphatase
MAVTDERGDLAGSTSRPHLNELIETRISRRTAIAGGMAAFASFLAPGVANAGGRGKKPPSLLGFDPIPLGFGDEVVVPRGYSARVIIPWGTPILGSYPAFRPGANSAEEQAQQIGMHHDGMHFFPLGKGPHGSRRGLLVLNHEYTDERYLHTGTTTMPPAPAWTLEMVRKSQNAHGVAVVEIERDHRGHWDVVRSQFNRRITANTPMTMSGPAAGHRLVRTAADTRGLRPLGTINNCAHGHTPWSTYLTCEENFHGYFRVDAGPYDEEHAALNAAYGIGGDRNLWATQDPRFVVTASDPNEPHRHGWVVEIDPFQPHSTPVKRTALGRIKHEGAFVHETKGGRVVVYMGDDEVNQYVYKFVSAGNRHALQARGRSPLDEGTLFVARFDADGSGEWLPLVHGHGPLTGANGFADQGDVLVKTRLAAAALGATPMDRPEWTSVDPNTGLVYVTLTNNTSAGKQENPANPRTPNRWGHILRWQEARGDHAATRFEWDIFLLAGQGRGSGDGSTIADEDSFGSPDGLWVDPDGRVWIQTDGSQPSAANDQMLAANPYVTDANGAPELRRFFTGVRGCEVTGVVTTPDQRTMFVNIQHPGESLPSTWPQQDGIATPRAATVVITKDDGGVIGT